MLFSSEVHSLVKISFGAQRGAGGAYSLVFVLYHKKYDQGISGIMMICKSKGKCFVSALS